MEPDVPEARKFLVNFLHGKLNQLAGSNYNTLGFLQHDII